LSFISTYFNGIIHYIEVFDPGEWLKIISLTNKLRLEYRMLQFYYSKSATKSLKIIWLNFCFQLDEFQSQCRRFAVVA